MGKLRINFCGIDLRHRNDWRDFGLVYTNRWGLNMNRQQQSIFGAMAFVVTAGASPAFAQSFQNYRCVDGTQFIVGFFEYDRRAHLQIDGKAMTLARRFGLPGERYSGVGVTLKITPTGATVKHARRPLTACELT